MGRDGGLVCAAIACIWLTVVLLTGPGATDRVLLVALLFVLPLLGIGAVAGWLTALAAGQIARLFRGKPL